jgi:hypothetical protein
MGKVAEAPASADSKVCSCYGDKQSQFLHFGLQKVDELRKTRACAQPVVGRCGVIWRFYSYLGIVRHLDKRSRVKMV